jgi:hypothetical protein
MWAHEDDRQGNWFVDSNGNINQQKEIDLLELSGMYTNK